MRRAAIAFVTIASLMVAACDEEAPPPAPEPAPTESQALTITDKGQPRVDIALPADRVTLEGTVISTTPTRLLLDYGPSEVTVDLGAWRVFRERNLIKPGDRVIVTGPIERDFLSKRVLAARSIFVAPIHSLFFVEGAADEDFGLGRLGTEAAEPRAAAATAAADAQARADGDAPGVRLAGFVTETGDGAFALGTEELRLEVDVSRLAEDPLDEEGFQRIVPGMRVLVWGRMDLENRRVVASRVISLIPNSVETPGDAPTPEASPTDTDLTLTDGAPARRNGAVPTAGAAAR